MGFIAAIITGALVGWIASMVMNTDRQMGALANILVGIFGSILGAWLFGSVLGLGGAQSAGEFSVMGIVWGIIGSVVLLALLKLFNVFGSDHSAQV